MTAVIWPVWLAAIVLMSVFGQTSTMRWLLMLLPFCFAASAAVTWLGSKKLLLSVKVKEGGAKEKGARGELRVENHSFLPIMQLRCTLLMHNLLTDEFTEQAISVPVVPNSKRKLNFRIKSQHCGQIVIVFKQVAAVDFFGITRYKLKVDQQAETIIMPDTFDMRVLPMMDSFCPEESDEYQPDRAGYDVSELYQIRDYVPGDSVRQIHWKLSGKYDQLMVKQAGQPLKHAMLLFLDFSAGKLTKTSPQCLDALAEVAVSLSQALLDAGIAHLVAWRQSNGELAHVSVQNVDDLTGAIPGILCAHEQGIPLSGQADNLFGNLRFSQVIWLCNVVPSLYFDTNAKMTVLCCADSSQTENSDDSEAVMFFTPKSYQRDMANLIL